MDTLRDARPLDRCPECGATTRLLVHEQGIDEDGAGWQAIYAQVVEHTRKDCARMVALYRETWPTLF
jgi:predicted nucleic acid-binding Zn ribbon protein